MGRAGQGDALLQSWEPPALDPNFELPGSTFSEDFLDPNLAGRDLGYGGSEAGAVGESAVSFAGTDKGLSYGSPYGRPTSTPTRACSRARAPARLRVHGRHAVPAVGGRDALVVDHRRDAASRVR